jgi:ribosomal protein S18 acetylase RimI-like enzyme
VTTRFRVDIRLATDRDNVLLAELGAETFTATFSAENTPEDMERYISAAFSPDIQAAELADPANVFLIAEESGVAVGYARLREAMPGVVLDAARPIEIVRLYARVDSIGRGVGAALMQASLEVSRARHCDAVWLGVWERNLRAIAFYRRWGFVGFGSHTFVLGQDRQNDLLMAKSLDPLPVEAADRDA